MLIIVVIAGYYGIDLLPLLGGETVPSGNTSYVAMEEDQEIVEFTSVALRLTEDTWGEIFQQSGKVYQPPKLVIYTDGTTTSCGYGQSAMGPFYCPADETVYIDLSFYQDMQQHLGGGGDFAFGYVIAHEVGHHVQHLLGVTQQETSSGANSLSVMMELQADCYAGIWGNAMQQKGLLEPGDIEEALNTAEAIGDDRLQRESSGQVVPDSFTHGTSEQRYTWFKRGFDTGAPNACDTFSSLH